MSCVNSICSALNTNSESKLSEEFNLEANMGQYKGSEYSNAVRVERGITLEEAFEIAKNDPQIDYFMFVKGFRMTLEIPEGKEPAEDPLHLVSYVRELGYSRVFNHGDVVFFKNEGKWLGTAPGLADVYSKK